MLTAITTVIIFLLMISLHEFGHFILGKALKFNVLEYAIGFGPAIFKKQGKKTLYSLRIIPFGGYCKFAGEDGEDCRGEGDFIMQAPWKRFIVLSAGAIFNILLGFLIFIIIVSNTNTISTSRIETVVENSYLYETGIQSGDKIIEINGKKVDFFQDIQLYTQRLDINKDIEMTVLRDNEKISVSFSPSNQKTIVRYLENNIEYEEIINGQKKVSQIEYSEENPKDNNKTGKEYTTERYIIGFVPQKEEITFRNILPNAYYMTKFVVKLVYVSLWDMVTGKVGIEQMSGPVGIVSEVNNAVHSGAYSILNVLNLTGLLTINLGIFNLLPLPALDGGRIVFVIIEWIRKKPIPPEKEGIIHGIGFILLIILMLFVCYQDILRLI